MIKSKKILRLEFEEPNKFFLGDKMENYDNEFHRIYTLCPYTSNWMNKKINLNKRVPIFFPFNENDIPNENRKIYIFRKYNTIHNNIDTWMLHDCSNGK